MNILNTLTKTQDKGIAVISTKTNGDVYEKMFQFYQVKKADKYLDDQMTFKKSGDLANVSVEIKKVLYEIRIVVLRVAPSF